MIPMSREAHACHVQILAAMAALGDGERLRTRAVFAMFPGVKRSLIEARLTSLERLGCIVRDGGVSIEHGGRGFVLGPKSLPPFDDSAARAAYETARSAYAWLASASDGLQASQLLVLSGESVKLVVMASRLGALERAGKVSCDRTVYPHVWRALRPALPDFDAMCAAEMARRSSQPRPLVTRRMRRVRPWLVGLMPVGSTSLGGAR